jgi:hypothetical protein
MEILTIVAAALFFATVPLYATTKTSVKVQLQLMQDQRLDVEAQSKIISTQRQIVSVLEKLTTTPTPSPSPSAVPHNP